MEHLGRRPREGCNVSTRAAVLDAATRLFVSPGCAATTMKDIAAEAGVSVESVYAQGTKPALLLVCVDRALAGTPAGSNGAPLWTDDQRRLAGRVANRLCEPHNIRSDVVCRPRPAARPGGRGP